jgi:alpha-galactosidase
MIRNMNADAAHPEAAGPGHWNDPDYLAPELGMTAVEDQAQFTMWAMLAAPLMIGNDVRHLSDKAVAMLTNPEVIAVDQDPLGKQGTVVSSEGGRWVVAKEMKDGSRAVALFNESDSAQHIATTAAAVGLPEAPAYTLRDLWQHRGYTAGTISATVPAHGTVLVRAFADRAWALHPPAVETGLDGSPLIEAGKPAALTSVVTDLGRTPALLVSAGLTGPDGWTVRAASPARALVLPTGRSLRTKWAVTAPPGTPTGSYALTLKTSYRSPTGARVDSAVPLTVSVVVPPPAGTSSLGDLPWLSATNGYGPVERDTSNGESKAGDGHPITLGGVVYAKGLGVHADSDVEFYTGTACTTLTADVGVDDEKGANGTVAFEVWADRTKVASTGVLTNAMPAQPLTANVTGAQVVRLVVTDGGDGNDSDHADWADARLTC